MESDQNNPGNSARKPAYPILSNRQIYPGSPGSRKVSPQKDFTGSSNSLNSSDYGGSRKFLNLIHEGTKFCLVQGDQAPSDHQHRSLGRGANSREQQQKQNNSSNWPFRSQSIDRSHVRRSCHLPMSESNTSLNAVEFDEDCYVTNRLSEEQQQQSAYVKNAHIKRLDNNTDASKVQLPDGNLSRSISHSFLPESPNTISRQQMLDSSPKISKASSKIALISRRSSVSSSREGSQERKMSEDPVGRPPLVRKPSWRRQSQVLQKARKFEAAYLKQRQDEQQRRNQPRNRFGQKIKK